MYLEENYIPPTKTIYQLRYRVVHQMSMYQSLRSQLMKTFPQLVIYDLREVSEIPTGRPGMSVHDLSNGRSPVRYYYGVSGTHSTTIILPMIQGSPEVEITYNLYGSLVRNFKHYVTYEQMEQLTQELIPSDLQLHWIWFREKGFYLPNKIVTRATSWIELNPTFRIRLWTNLTDRNELDDFLSKLTEDRRKLFTDGKIEVKYQNDLTQTIEQFIRVSPVQTEFLRRLFTPPSSITTATTRYETTATHNTMTTVIQTEIPNNYKINRIFRVDLLRIILLCLYGGVYADFNDTICFFPMKYLLTMYRGQFLVGTDYDLEHPVFRNNYFLYTPQDHPEFLKLCVRCLENASHEYLRITHPSYIHQYYQMSLQLMEDLSKTHPNGDLSVISTGLGLASLQQLLAEDPRKDAHRVLCLINDIYGYWAQEYQIEIFINLHQQMTEELELVDQHALRFKEVRRKRRKNRKTSSTSSRTRQLGEPIDRSWMDTIVASYHFHDYFLLKYATHMTIGDLILNTNLAYTDEIKNLVPYLRLNRLSTISMLTHLYDGTSYGLNRVYEPGTPTASNSTFDLKRDLL